MKLLLDENLSPKLVKPLASTYPDSVHVNDIGLTGRDDITVWQYARSHGFTIVSKDNDFRQMAFLQGPPPKVIWLAVGNAGTKAILQLLLDRATVVKEFHSALDESLLVLEFHAKQA